MFLGNGDGTFTSGQVIPNVGDRITGSFSIAVADFNADGKLDLATEGYEGIAILLGNGDGTFTAAASLAATGVSALVSGDFNGDGVPDLAATTNSNNESALAVFMGTGNGAFTALSTSLLPGNPTQECITTGDLIGNGNLDLAVANCNLSTVTVQLGNRDGTFTAAGTSPAIGSDPIIIAVSDFDGAGAQDLVTTNITGGTVTVLLAETQTAAATVAGVAVLSVATGVHMVVASCMGDSKNSASISMSTPLTALQGTPTASLMVSPGLPDHLYQRDC